jgi:conjugative relaxase-like TrwC/TraI family protein
LKWLIRLTNVRAGHERYYLDQVALGSEAPGWWLGGLCPELGLAGEVGGEQLRLLLDSRRPVTGERLRTRPSPVRGRDLTFSEPKSVSVLWGLGGPEVATGLEEAHGEALRAACSYLERRAVQLGNGSRSEGMAAAVFAHRTSRAGDPHLHTHVVVANLGRAEGPYRALDGLVLSAQARTAGLLYQAHLRHAVTARLGLEWGEVDNGVAQLRSVPAELRGVFSRRRAQVEAGMALHHGASARSARLAALVDRPERVVRDWGSLVREWRDRAERAGYTADDLVPHRVHAGRDRGENTGGEGEGAQPIERGLAELGLDSRSSFSRADVSRRSPNDCLPARRSTPWSARRTSCWPRQKW